MHKAHSGRILSVTKDCNPLYYALLAAFKEKTGIGLLLNTSLNRRGMPIVETPDDALMLFIYSAIDVLVMEEYVVCKPPDFEVRMAKFSALVAQHTARRTFQNVLNA